MSVTILALPRGVKDSRVAVRELTENRLTSRPHFLKAEHLALWELFWGEPKLLIAGQHVVDEY
jgi:hypothetical protein